MNMNSLYELSDEGYCISVLVNEYILIIFTYYNIIIYNTTRVHNVYMNTIQWDHVFN